MVWWKDPNQTRVTEVPKKKTHKNEFKDEDESWEQKGLDHKSLEMHNNIKSHWRHVRTRLYFTSASHMYTLLNVLKFGLSSLDMNKKFKLSSSQTEDVYRMDFMSGIFFRVFENLISDENDPARFKLEICVNKGSTLDPNKVNEIENHCIEIKLDNSFSKTLTLDDVDSFFNVLLDMQEVNSSNSSTSPDI